MSVPFTVLIHKYLYQDIPYSVMHEDNERVKARGFYKRYCIQRQIETYIIHPSYGTCTL